jgi:sigma-B regulation protein RsbU (phosphoserine phosphatase)
VNDDLALRNESCTFVTLFAGILDVRTGEIVFRQRRPHLPAPADRRRAVAPRAGEDQHGRGRPGGPDVSRETLALRPGDVLVLYTDGVTEAFKRGRPALRRRTPGPLPRRACRRTPPPRKSSKASSPTSPPSPARGKQSDDITMLVLRICARAGAENHIEETRNDAAE